MVGLDTNVLVRYLTQDDPAQAKAADDLVERAESGGEALFINGVVLCELVWVLDSCYGLSSVQILDVLEKVMRTRQFEIDGKDVVWLALDDYREGSADFADCLIGRTNLSRGCALTYTLDKAAAELHGYRLLT